MHKNRHYPALGICLLFLVGCGSGSGEPAQQTGAREEAPKAASSGDAEQISDAALIATGKAAFVNCVACHNIVDGTPAKTGPNLYAVVGRNAGTEEGFSYSSALRSSDITWTEAELDAFLTDPAARVSGTKMTVGLVPNSAKRRAIIAYLKDQSSN